MVREYINIYNIKNIFKTFYGEFSTTNWMRLMQKTSITINQTADAEKVNVALQ